MAPTQENKIKQYKALRQLQIDLLDEILVLAQASIDDQSLHVRFKLRFDEIDKIHDEFQDLHKGMISALATSEQPDFEEQKKIRSSFLENLYSVKAIYANLFGPNNSGAPSASSPNVKLPKICLPVFDGNYKNWPTFYDLFTTLIHSNSSLSNIEKFQYLLSSLSAEVLPIVKGIPITSDNYGTAFASLVQRYQNRRLLANSCWQSILSIPKLNNDSPNGLRKLLETISENLSALKNLNLPVDKWDFVLFHILIQKLDSSTVKRYELQEASTDLPSFPNLKTFLLKQCIALETVSVSSSDNSNKKSPNSLKSHVRYNFHSISSKKSNSSFLTQSNSQSKTSCNYCQGRHTIYKCYAFLKKTAPERLQITHDKGLCLNCLHSAHDINACSSKSTCRICHSSGHHTLLHMSNNTNEVSKRKEYSPADADLHKDGLSTSSQNSSAVQALTNVSSKESVVLLSTAIVEVSDALGNYHSIRVLIDSGSQISAITQRFVNKLGLRMTRLSLSVCGIGKVSASVSGSVTCNIRPLGEENSCFVVNAVVLPKICSPIPTSLISPHHWEHISNLKLADPRFHVPEAVDMLLGADLFPLILRDGRVSRGPDEPVAINTIFGWILCGKTGISHHTNAFNSFHITVEPSLDSILKRFWEIEEKPSPSPVFPSEQEKLCENIYQKTYSRNSRGRYIVALPFKCPETTFGDSKSNALRRFLSLEFRLLRNPTLLNAYHEVMRDYLQSGHMELVTSQVEIPGKVFYIPHHPVINPNSTTTRLRVVFDASAKISKDEPSLNDTLLIGQKLQKDIVTLLLHFRLHAVVFTADIKQMYRQIQVRPQDQDYQRILWRFSPDEPIKEYNLKTVTFGVASAPFLALRTLKQLVQDEGKKFPSAAHVVDSDVFVDDIVTGCSNTPEALKIKSQLISLLDKGGFLLRKWASNNMRFLESIPKEHRHQHSLSFSTDDDSSIKILGLRWRPSSDIFSYSVNVIDRSCTKRSMLSELAKIFDPLGFLSPVTFLAKYLIQRLWTLGLEWDQVPDSEVVNLWNRYKRELPQLGQIKIPRQLSKENSRSCQLHGFCDSSERGYAAVIYFRFEHCDGSFSNSLILSKTKVAPLKRISLPRLELCACLLLSQLISSILDTYRDKITFSDIFAWSDSSVAISWIRTSPHLLKTFVANRVSQIQDIIPPERWFHIASKLNPADCATRGVLPSDLLDHTLWWAGPPWLAHPQTFWPANSFEQVECEDAVIEERRMALSSVMLLDTLDSLLERFSSLNKIKRIIGWCFRFIRAAKSPQISIHEAFTKEELHKSLLVLVRRVQYNCFSDLFDCLTRKKPIPKPFRKLSPFLAEDGVLRVGGRLFNSGLQFEQKHPALLPRNHRLTELIIEEVHKENLHPGLQTLHFLLLQNFWILSPRRAIRHVISKCFRCFKANPKPFQPPMGNLPPIRVSQAKPFQYVGVDFAGPFFITLSKSRGVKSQKAYLCLFVCCATKALHLELASDLSSECFIAALRRFVARRGHCSQLFSDRGGNFIGAERELINMMKQASETEAISWSFNPPSTPHFGGLWEAGVKSVKSHLRRVIGDQILTYEEFNTVLVQIESILNSRPICPLSSDPNDISVLTPGHFLNLDPVTSIPTPDLTQLSVNRLSRWQLLQRIQQEFWRRWHLEYLNTLQQKAKWAHSNPPNITEGMLMLIKEDNLPPLKWRLARVEKLHMGTDGICRVATLRTAVGSLKRPLVKLCPLPSSGDSI